MPLDHADTPQSIKAEVIALKKERILTAAADLFAQKGFHNVAMGEVAQSIGATKPFVYSYYKDKNALLFAICRRGAELTAAAQNEALALDAAPEIKLRTFFRRFAELVIENATFITVYSREVVNLKPDQSDDISALRAEIDRRFAQWLANLDAQGLSDSLDPKISATAVTLMLSTVWSWYKDKSPEHREHFVSTLENLALRMIGFADGTEKTEIER